MRISPLRLWLQSSSLLAVLAGYFLLLLVHQGLASFQRRDAHRSIVNQLASDLAGRATSRSPQQLGDLLELTSLPGLRLQLAAPSAPIRAGQAPEPPRVLQEGDQVWMASTVEISLADGGAVALRVEQNVTESVQQERLGFLLLVVAAGIASLLTSGLLRLVLRRGLGDPLEAFTAQLRGVQAPPRLEDLIAVEEQPEELRPIAVAFNDLQQRLTSSWERQRNFVDGVAHELRTPITLVSGHAQRLLRQAEQPATVASLRLIQQEASRMGTLVSDLLDLARQDSGRLQLRRHRIVAEDALLEVFERLAPTAQGRLRLANSGPGEAPLPVAHGDPERLQQCLLALVDNALLYSPASAPVTLAADTSGSGQVVLHVLDRGPGVAADERQLIFERFARGSAAIRSQQRGSGIGLAVVKLLIEAMGGRVSVEEAPGGGADFQLHLPLMMPSVKPSAAPPSA